MTIFRDVFVLSVRRAVSTSALVRVHGDRDLVLGVGVTTAVRSCAAC